MVASGGRRAGEARPLGGRKHVWTELVAGITKEHQFRAPASPAEIGAVARTVGCELPSELIAALEESNGIYGPYTLGLIWNTEMMIEQNEAMRSTSDFRELYMPFNCLLFFGDAGNGDLFGYSILDGEVRKNDIFAWNHEDDSRTWVAPNLQRYLEWWLTGKIKL
jgi:hypothetical protein